MTLSTRSLPRSHWTVFPRTLPALVVSQTAVSVVIVTNGQHTFIAKHETAFVVLSARLYVHETAVSEQQTYNPEQSYMYSHAYIGTGTYTFSSKYRK